MPQGEKANKDWEYGYHGTARDLSEVLPPSVGGQQKEHDDSDANWTYMTDNPGEAWTYATQMTQLHGGRPRVYQTNPMGEQFIDDSRSEYYIDPQNDAPRVVKSQKVVDAEWSPAPPNRQGAMTVSTLPHINWRQFGATNYTVHTGTGLVYDDLNTVISKPNELKIVPR